MAYDPSDRIELDFGDTIVVLDGNVVEVFLQEAGISKRWHVSHIRVEAKPSRKGDRLHLIVDTVTAPTRSQSISFDIAIEDQPVVIDLFDEAKRRRHLHQGTTPP
jgi:hypothetical protein